MDWLLGGPIFTYFQAIDAESLSNDIFIFPILTYFQAMAGDQRLNLLRLDDQGSLNLFHS